MSRTGCRGVLVCALLLAVPCCLAAVVQQAETLSSDQKSAVDAPVFPESYEVSYTYSLPYTAQLQPHGIRYPVTFWRDHHHRRIRMDTYDGTNSMITKDGVEYEVVPRIDTQHCLVWKTSGGPENGELPAALPDVRGWEYAGVEALTGGDAHVWLYEARHEGKRVQYKFFVREDGTPVRLHMHGSELFDGAHFDEWVADYTDYKPGRPAKEAFATPGLCQGKEPGSTQAGLRLSTHGLRMQSLLPGVKYAGDPQYDAFLASPQGAGRQLRSLGEYQLRAEVLRSNAALIQAHNSAPGRTYSMAINRFGDWTEEEFRAIMLPNRSRLRQTDTIPTATPSGSSSNVAKEKEGDEKQLPASDARLESKYQIPHKPHVDPSRVPASVSWRGTGAEGTALPKDQANCGSCWAFGATGAMEGAWFLATGQQVSFSEQQLMDCSWGHAYNKACDGGDAYAAIEYVAETGGIALLEEYEYLGQDGYCRTNSTRRVGKFKGFSRIPHYDNQQLMEALYTRGPLAVSIDASQPSFRFYSGGVYYDPTCKYKPSELDHSVMLMGFGTDEKAGDYWLIRNSWSSHWGDQGYIAISRDNYGCGIPNDAVYAVVDEDAL